MTKHVAVLVVADYVKHTERHRNPDEDSAVRLQAENKIIRIERAFEHLRTNGMLPDSCVTCAEPIPPERRAACPETIWCTECVEAYDELRRKSWAHRRPTN